MQPWKISAGLTATIAGVAFILGIERLEYLRPYWRVLLIEHGLTIGVHLGLGLATVAAIIYVVARAAGLADLGRRVDLAERSVRKGGGDAGLADALRKDADGKWE